MVGRKFNKQYVRSYSKWKKEITEEKGKHFLYFEGLKIFGLHSSKQSTHK